MWDFNLLPVWREFGKFVMTQINIKVTKANQPGKRKISLLKGPIYILNLLAFAEIGLF